jgi:predicted ATP-dependent endonuclease of OLD family
MDIFLAKIIKKLNLFYYIIRILIRKEVIFYLICSGYNGLGSIQNKTSLLLLDELDAYLNPVMSKMFIEIVNDILVKKFKIQVIMTTHSPSTVAYTPEENLFWMENGKIDRPAYIFVKNINESELKGILTLKKLYSKNGFSFYVRMPAK